MGSLTGLHADSGSGKTSFLGSICLWVSENRPDRKCRLVTAENYEGLEPYEKAGILDVWNIAGCEHPFEMLNYACRGYWPDEKGKLQPLKGRGDVAFQFFEGGSTFSDMLMYKLSEFGGDGISIGPGTRTNTKGDSADLISFKDGEYGVGGNARSHYNIVQKEMRANIKATGGLPFPIIWTFHTVKATDGSTPIFGPQLTGSAATPKVQSWFSSLLHLHKTPKDEHRLCLKQHTEKETGPIPFKAVQRIPLQLLDPSTRAKVEEKWEQIVPAYIDWTNDSRIAEKYIGIRDKMREAVVELLKTNKQKETV